MPGKKLLQACSLRRVPAVGQRISHDIAHCACCWQQQLVTAQLSGIVEGRTGSECRNRMGCSLYAISCRCWCWL